MSITVNGEEKELEGEAATVASLLEELGFGDRPVVVEHNGEAVLTKKYGQTALAPGDRIEIVQIVAGG